MKKICKYAYEYNPKQYECTASRKVDCEYQELDLNPDGSINLIFCIEQKCNEEH